MKVSTKIAMFSATALFATTLAIAAEPTQGQTAELQNAKKRLASKAVVEKGLPKAQLQMEQRRVGDLIDDLEAGRRVDPSEIDRALDRANQLAR